MNTSQDEHLQEKPKSEVQDDSNNEVQDEPRSDVTPDEIPKS